ncbi:extracellular solute-binding protein [Microbacterium sp. NPDC057650]|uniref:extracellular solute-binding protein n=1 Tax=unclassified Microbacterium TaxID=2609290 RepID=UPI00366AC376
MVDHRISPVMLDRRGFFGLAAAASLFALAGCSSGGTGSASGGGAAGGTAFRAPKYVAPEASDALLVSKVEGVPPIVIKPVQTWIDAIKTKPASGGDVTALEIIWSGPGSPLKSNDRWQAVNKELGATLKPTLVPSGSYDQKTATILASGKVPDLAFILDETPTVAQAIEDGAFADLSDVLAGDGILKYPNLAKIETSAWKAAAKNGRIYGVPSANGLVGQFPVIRTDLMAQVGFTEVPGDTENFGKMLTELAKLKRDSAGRRFYVHNTLNQGGMPLFRASFGIGADYSLDGKGELTAFMLRDEYPDFIAYVADLWKKDVFHPDTFGTNIDNRQFGLGKEAMSVAGFSGHYWRAEGQVNKLLGGVPGAKVTHFVFPSAAGTAPVFSRSSGYWGIVALSAAAAKDEKRRHELLSIADWFCAPYNSKEQRLIRYGVEGLDFTIDDEFNVVSAAREGHEEDGSATNLGISGYPVNFMPSDTVHLAENVLACMEGMVTNTVDNPVAGIVNQAKIKKDAALTQVITDYQNGMVTGRKPVTQVKEFRKAWLSQGGQAVLDEYKKTIDEAK